MKPEPSLRPIPPTLPGGDYGIHAGRDCFKNARVFRSRVELSEHCKGLTPGRTICEIGSYLGVFSRHLLDTFAPERLYLVDIKTSHLPPALVADPAVHVLTGLSWDVLSTLPDRSLDYIYVDGGHDYDSVRKDIAVSHKKIKSGGIIQFNDYCTYSPPERMEYGVLNAVNAYIEMYQHELVGISIERSGYHDLAIRVRK